MTLKEIKDYIVSRIYPNSSQKITGEVMQDTLSKMADASVSPSGDPMHYVYLSYYGVTYDEQTNLYTVGYLTNLTADDMRKAFAMYGGGIASAAFNSWVDSYQDNTVLKNELPRTTLPVFGSATRLYYDKIRFSFCWNELEQIALCYLPDTPIAGNSIKIWQYNSSEIQFYLIALEKLKYIVDTLYCNMSYDLNIFKTLPMLTEVRLLGLQGNVSFERTPHLSKESLLYMIDNCADDKNFTITLHPNVYAKHMGEWLEDVDSAIGRAEEKGTNIMIASA